MSMKAIHAIVTLVIGVTVGIVWLRAFWREPGRVPGALLYRRGAAIGAPTTT